MIDLPRLLLHPCKLAACLPGGDAKMRGHPPADQPRNRCKFNKRATTGTDFDCKIFNQIGAANPSPVSGITTLK